MAATDELKFDMLKYVSSKFVTHLSIDYHEPNKSNLDVFVSLIM